MDYEMDYVKLHEIVIRHEERHSEWVAKIKRDIKDLSGGVQYDEAQLLTDISQLFRELGDFAQGLQERYSEWIAKRNNQSTG